MVSLSTIQPIVKMSQSQLLSLNGNGPLDECISLVFQVYNERPMVIGSLNLKLRQIVKFSSNVILDEMSSAKCRLLFLVNTKKDHFTMYICGNFSFYCWL